MNDSTYEAKGYERLKPVDRLTLCVRACQALVYVVAADEDRVVPAMRDALKSLSATRKIHRWSVVTGLAPLDPDKLTSQDPIESVERFETFKGDPQALLLRAPLNALGAIRKIEAPAVFVLHDFHKYFDGSYPLSPIIVRHLRDQIEEIRLRKQVIVFLSPLYPALPPELERDVEVIDFGLPDRQALGEVYDNLSPMAASTPPDVTGHRDRVVRASQGLTAKEAEQAMVRSILLGKTIEPRMVAAQKEQTIRRNQAVEFIADTMNLEDVGGLDLLKAWLSERRESYSDGAAEAGVVPPKGMLLLGVPGSGKSLVAKAVASVFDYPLLRLDVGSVFGSLVGQSEANMRRALSTAEAVSPCVLWLDEIEKAFGGVMGGQDSGVGRRLFGYFLTWLQEKRAPIFVVATANSVTDLPPEFLRQGRFDQIFFLDLPSKAERADIWRLQIARKRTEEQSAEHRLDAASFDVEALANDSDGFSGAEIEQVVLSAIQRAFSQRRKVRQEDFTVALQSTTPLSKTRNKEILELRTWAQVRARPASSRQDNVEATSPVFKASVPYDLGS